MNESTTLGDERLKGLIQVDPRIGELQTRYPSTKKVVNLPASEKLIVQEAAVKRMSVWEVLDERESRVMAHASFDGVWSSLIQYAYQGQLEFFSALTSSLLLFTPTPLDATHTLLIRLRFDPRSDDPTLSFKIVSCAALAHGEVKKIVASHPNHHESTDVGLGEMGSEAIRKRGEFKGGKDSCWYLSAVFLVEEGFENAVVTTRYVEMPKQEKPDFKTQTTKRWAENYVK
ncbi:hypothetical protein P7C70_g2614, partial [Phenoliferia sp. Uapishka_3]